MDQTRNTVASTLYHRRLLNPLLGSASAALALVDNSSLSVATATDFVNPCNYAASFCTDVLDTTCCLQSSTN